MKINPKTLLAASILVAYLAAVIRVIVFKDIHVYFFALHLHVPSHQTPGAGHSNYVPFQTILLYLNGMSRRGAALANLLGNVVPFLPIGMLLPGAFRTVSWKGVLGFAVAFSLGLETLQRVLHVGAFDVDDILLNTVGVLLGYRAFLLLARRKPRWGSVRLRMTLWNVAALALILGVLGAVVRYKVQADLFATVDRTLAERAQAARSQPVIPVAPPAETRPDSPDRGLSMVEGLPLGSRLTLPPIQPRLIPRDEPWDRDAYRRALTGRTVFSTIPAGRTTMRVLSLPVERQGKVDAVLQLVYPLGGVLEQIDALTSTLLALVPFGLLAAGLGGAFLTGRALRPVREMAEMAARLGANDLSERLPVSGHDEFSELSSSFNAMLARLDEAFDRQRRFTADASHELRTPLSIIRTNTGLALEHPWPEERYRDFLTAIDTAAGRQGRIVEELLFLARADAGRLARDVGPVCLIEALEEAAESVSRPPRIQLESIDPALLVSGSGSELTRLFTNLLENAVRHTPPEGTVTVSARVDALNVTVTVTDTGEGIAPEHLPHVTERFYRVDAARTRASGGTGLGLSLCQTIVQAHHGTLEIQSAVGAGTTVTVRLPAAA